MANRITIQDGYTLPFDGARRKRRKSRRRHMSGALKKQQNKMKTCAKKWRSYKGGQSYRSFMKHCL